MRRVGISLLALGLVLVLAGCSSVAEKATEKAFERQVEKDTGGKANVDVEKNSVEIQTEEGTVRVEGGEGAQLPDNFPSDVPVYKGAKITGSMTQSSADDSLTGSAVFAVDAGFRDVADFYRNELKKAGYRIEATMDVGDTVQLVAVSADGKRQVTVQAVKKGEGAEFVIMYGSR